MPDIIIRPEQAADYPAVAKLIVEVFRDAFGTGPQELSIVEQMRDHTAWGPVVSLVADLDGEILGHILLSPVRLAEHPDVPICTLGPVGVAKPWQRQSIGDRLIRAGLDACRTLGYRLCVLTGHLDYYPRFGFVPIAQTRLKTIFDTPVDMAMALQPDVLAQVSGLVEYPEPWLAFVEKQDEN